MRGSHADRRALVRLTGAQRESGRIKKVKIGVQSCDRDAHTIP